MPRNKLRLNFLITAGPTVEPIDPVRYLSNRSSGKMGYALARAALRQGHRVTLISGPVALVPPEGCRFVPVETCREMLDAALKEFPRADVVIKTAAVADYRPATTFRHKMKKGAKRLVLELTRNPDILATLGKRKRARQTLVGFAAETRDLMRHAAKKIRAKNLDWIAANDVSRRDIGFGGDQNEITLIGRDGTTVLFARQPKSRLAARLVRRIATEHAQKKGGLGKVRLGKTKAKRVE